MEYKYFYLVLMLLSVFYPLWRSFESKIRFYTKWGELFRSIFCMMLFFIPWDIHFTYHNIWHFNDKMTLGVDFLLLPLEEWLFFIIIPFCCVFIHEVLCYFFPLQKVLIPNKLLFFLSIILLIIALFYNDRLYTLVCFLFTSLVGFYISKLDTVRQTSIVRTYLVSLFPFLIINGLLTGSFVLDPIVFYNHNEILGFRILNIPIEDFFYNFSMIAVVLFFYQLFLDKNQNDFLKPK